MNTVDKQSAKPQVTVTTSWDDGHRLDWRVAELLDEYQLPGTFYISPLSTELMPDDHLRREEIAAISERFEVGAHTMTHPRLTNLTQEAARKEIIDSRVYLEEATGCPVTSFCYPYGLFNEDHVRLVREAGFSYARTVRRFSFEAAEDPLRSSTTVHAYSHLVDIPPVIACAKLNLINAWDMYSHWDRLAQHLFDQVLDKGGIFHIWGHSWEVERNNDWEPLHRILEYISRRPDVNYVVNGKIYDTESDAT